MREPLQSFEECKLLAAESWHARARRFTSASRKGTKGVFTPQVLHSHHERHAHTGDRGCGRAWTTKGERERDAREYITGMLQRKFCAFGHPRLDAYKLDTSREMLSSCFRLASFFLTLYGIAYFSNFCIYLAIFRDILALYTLSNFLIHLVLYL